MASLSFQHVYKKYDGGVVAVSDFNLDVADKEFVILVGPSGCGKSTTLRMLAGLEDISEGEIYIDDRCVNDVLPKDRDIAMVFQNYALYPHMSVRDNMAFALKLRKMPKDEINRRVQEAAKILEIEHLLDRKPKALSGGQRQRVALGRAILRDPKVFLMDEPLSNLDAKLRVQMRVEITKLHHRLKTTFVYVTHVLHNYDSGTHGHSFCLVVCNVNECCLKSVVELCDLNTHLYTELSVQVGERLVHEEDLRVTYDSTAESNSLTLTTGESLRLSV